eukprot:6206412-Pleurochrysis_carterae.AAC.1
MLHRQVDASPFQQLLLSCVGKYPLCCAVLGSPVLGQQNRHARSIWADYKRRVRMSRLPKDKAASPVNKQPSGRSWQEAY